MGQRTATTVELAEAFMGRFAGMSRAYGTYDLSRVTVREDGKRSGAAITKRDTVTVELWMRHISGLEPGIGIIPIRDGNDCTFGAIDIDTYVGLSHQSIVAQLSRASIPLIVCRTKSGGAHLYCFAAEPVPAGTMRSKLSEVASYLGHGDCEIFPKQTQVLTDQGDAGSWLNMPYFGGMRGMRYAVDIGGSAMTPEEFLQCASESAVSPQWFEEKIIGCTDFADGPPCLQALAQVGYPPGTRSDGLYNIGVYLKRSRPDTWETDLDAYNHRFMEPPLMLSEVQGTLKSGRKKDYSYACTRSPINNHCNAALCRTRKYGVGSGAAGKFPMLGGLTKLNTKPPIWFWTVDGVRMELSTADLQDPRSFQRRCMDYLNAMPQLPSAPVWQAAVQHAMDTVTTVEAPSDASPEGLFWDMMEKFCTGRAQAQSIDDIRLGKPFTDGGRTYFRMQDLLAYLSMHKFFEFRSPKIASLMRDASAKHHFKIMKGRPVNFWSLAEFAKQSEGFDVPAEVSGVDAPF